MKQNITIVLLMAIGSAMGQQTIKFGTYQAPVYLVDSTNFRLFGNWKIIHKEKDIEERFAGKVQYVHLKEDMGIDFDGIDLTAFYRKDKEQFRECMLGNYVYFGEDYFLPFSTNVSRAVQDPIYKKSNHKAWSGGYDLFHHLGLAGKELLFIGLYCPNYQEYPENVRSQSELSLAVINDYLLILFVPDGYVFLERDDSKPKLSNLWKTDEQGFNTAKMMGYSEIEFTVSNNKKQIIKDEKIVLKFKKAEISKNHYVHISTYLKGESRCSSKTKRMYFNNLDKFDSINYNGEVIMISSLKNYNNIITVSGNCENQEELWEVKWKITDKIKSIKMPKSTVYFSPNKPTKMYLIKNDPVEILEDKDNWLRIRYYGKETIEGWIRKEDVE